MMSAMNQAAILLSIVCSGAAVRSHGSPTLLEVDGVVQTIFKVEQRWMDLAAQAVECGTDNCTTNATEANNQFNQSCASVSASIIKATAGDKARLQSYMVNVCGDESLKGEKEELCLDLAQLMAHQMGDDQHANQEGGVDFTKVCADLFQSDVLSRATAKVAEIRKQEATKRAEEAEQKREEAELAKQQAAADEKAAEARKRLEALANHTKVVSDKREEAVRLAVEAQRKAEEVESAESVHRRLEEQAQAADKEAKVLAAKADKLTQSFAAKANASHATVLKNVTAFVEEGKPVMRKSFLANFPNTFA